MASNPCGTSSAAIVPIYVSQKPTASFTISPKDTICVNRTVTFTNTTLGKYVESGSCIDGKSVWSILPSTGWSLTSGSFGNTFGLSDPSTWTGGSNGLSISFNTVGVYSIKLKTGNPNCGIDSIIKTVCIIPVPTASFTLDKSDGCLPLVINTSATTNIINCGTNNFNWSVTYSSISGCLPNLSGFTYINSTNSNSQNPQLQFNNPGVYTINLVTISPGGICSSQIVSQQVTVKGKPNISFTSPSSLCQGLSFSPVSTVTCNVSTNSYLWSFPGGNPTNSTSANPGAIIYNTPGSYSISLTVTNECGSNILIKPIIINTAPASSTAGSNSPLCSGNTLNLTSSVAPAGATYSWTGPGGFTSTLQNPSRTNTTTAMSGAYNVTVNLNGCASTSSTVNVTINQTPTLLSVTTPINYCQGATAVQLTATASTGNTLLWYSTATGGTGSATAPTPLTTSIGTTTYYVSQVNSTATCESGRAAIVVNVGTIPSINGNSTNPTSCTSSNGTITLSGLTSNTTYSVQYTKNGGTPTIVNLIANSSGIITIANLSAGAYTNISAMLNGCPSNLVGPYTLVDPSAPASPIANATSPLCSGSTLNLNSTAAPTGGTYAWTGPGGFTSTLQNPSRANTTTAMSGTYSVTVNLNGCASTPATVNVTINQTPTLLTVTTPISYCQGATAMQLSATASTGNTLLWYNAATGGTGSSTAPTPLTTSIGTTTYYVSQINSTTSCESGRVAVIVNINAFPNISASSNNPATCTSSNGTISLTGLVSSTSYNVQYTKDGGVLTSITLTSNSNGVATIANLSSGIYTNISVTLNGCQSNIVGPFTLVNPSAPTTPIANATSPLCSGSTLNLNSTAAPTGGTYAWTGPGGFTSTLQNPSRANTTTAMSGTYSVTVNLNGCASTPATVNVTINQTPTLLTVTTPISYCQGATAMQLSATASTGNTLLWYNAATGGTGSSTAPTPLTTSIGTTTYYVSQVNSTATCESGRTAIVVNVGAIPSINGNSTNPTSCTSSNGLINLTGLSPNTTFSVQYIKDGGLLISTTMTSNGNGVITISNLSSGVYSSVGVDLNGCLSNLVGPYTLVDPSAPATPIASFTSPLCTGYTLNLTSSAAPAGATYAWTGPGGFTSTLQNPSRANATTAMSGTYSVTVNLNSCASLSGSIIVLVSENPIVDLGPDLLLDPSTVHTLASSIQNGPISTFVWSPSTYLSCTNCASPIANINSDITYSLKATNIYGCSGSDTIKIKVRCDNTQVYIPNAFTPDGDGINDLLIVRASGLVTIKYFRVFNRWGEMIFEKYNFPPNTSSFGWDGKIKGIVGPSDVFVYVAEVLCPNGSTFFYKGNTSILK